MESKNNDINDFFEEGALPETAADEKKTVLLSSEEHAKLLKDIEEYKDKNLRLYAEFENARKRMERDRQDFIKYANEGLIIEFLEILDNFERILEAAKNNHEDKTEFLKGVDMVIANIKKLLDRHDVRPIDAKGKKFDPHCQEILMQEEVEGQEEGIVLEEFQKGYYLGERVVRTAKVKVAKGKNS